ncbi:MAG: CDP-diacylglycerol--glycerol-3-phosphate 3-phosphatidyltransferase [Clostridia bacterium]|nr:CDP-diacylglycerol--glycerol-3-phosphate 3-phosphatidyltransferase [Clostridia bacterium]
MENDTSSWINVPNCLTILRMLLIPVFLIAYDRLPEKRYISMCVFALASATDCLDGYLARRNNQITSFGKLCDPLADKLMVLSILFCLASDGYLAPVKYQPLNWIIMIAMLVKEFIMMCGSMAMLQKGVVVQANIWGKAATCLFVMGILLVFPWHGVEILYSVGHVVIVLAALTSFTALVSYVIDCVKKLNALKIN